MKNDFFEEDKGLSACETVIMKAIWDEEEDISIQNLIEVLRTKWGKDYARTTVVTFLLKLTAKGYVQTYRKGKNSYARAIKSEEDYKAKLVAENRDFWFGGKLSGLLSALCRERKLTQEEADEIRQILDDNTTD
jgi:predicted transcriptional regulator